MKKTRVSELAHELRCKASIILGVLPKLGIKYAGAITHNTRLETEDAEKIRRHFVAHPPPKPQPRRKWVNDADGTLGIAKGIANRFGEEIVEDEFFIG
jgi:hypothetical protein